MTTDHLVQIPLDNYRQRQNSTAAKMGNNKNLFYKCAAAVTICLLFLWLIYTPASSLNHDNVASTSTNIKKDVPHMDQVEQQKQCVKTETGEPSTEYAVMIDAGSSGSRVHVYKFTLCNDYKLEDEVFHMLEPGLSSYKDDSQAAAQSLSKLMEIAVDSVPAELHSCTPIAVKATAGLRLLGTQQSQHILDAVHAYLSKFKFPIANIEIMDGKDEGVYAWITVNYLLNKLNKGKSVAVFDLGGASTQIVYEPSTLMIKGDHEYSLNYQNMAFNLYQHSYLGYGLNEARKRIKSQVITDSQQTHYHPCLPANHTEQVNNAQIVGTGAGHTACRAVIEKVFNKDKLCELGTCAFDGVYQPTMIDSFRTNDLYIFSYFYDLTQPLGMPSEFSVRELGELTEKVCQGVTSAFQHVPKALQLLKDTPDYCMDLSYIYNLLRFGYEIPLDRLVKTAKKIHGAETGWCLGASIAMMDSNALVCTQ